MNPRVLPAWPKNACWKSSRTASRNPFLKFGDRVRIEMYDAHGATLFGAIEQTVEKYHQM